MFGTLSRRRAIQRRERKLLMQPLESRQPLAADVFVNDNWFVRRDLDASGTLTAGDVVDNRLDVTGGALVRAKLGTTAFTDIDAAVSAVDEGGTVTVLEGQYSGDFEISKSVTLKGANAGVSAGAQAETRGDETVIDGGLRINADDVTVDGFTITGGNDIGGDVAGIYLAAGAEGAVISNNILTGDGTGRGILSTFNGGNDNVTIENNDIGNWTTGIFNQTNDGVQVVGNLIHDNVSGVANDESNAVTIQGNDFKDNDEAIGTLNSTDLTITGNDLAGNTVAISNYGGEDVDATANFFGTVDPDEIDDLVTEGVLANNPLASSPFEMMDDTELVFTGRNGLMLTVNSDTGDFQLTRGDRVLASGTGAVVKNDRLRVHIHDAQGRKIDIKGTVDGSVEVVLKQSGHGQNKHSFTLTAQESQVA